MPCAACQPAVVVVGERVDEAGEPAEPLRVGADQDEQRPTPTTDEHAAKSRARRADQPQQAEQDRDQHERGAEVAAEHDQADHQDHAGHQRDEQCLDAGEQLLLAGVDVRAPQTPARAWRTRRAGSGPAEESQFWLPLTSTPRTP